METLKNFTLDDLFKVLALQDKEFEEWLKELKLLHTTRFCDCGNEMSYKWKQDRQQPLWICYSRKNHDGKRPTAGYFTGTFFEGAHLSPKQVFKFSYYWAHKFANDQIMFQMKLGSDTVTDWKNFMRDVTSEFYSRNPIKIGAAGATVENISDFLWRKQFGGPDIFYNLWSQIAELYPINT